MKALGRWVVAFILLTFVLGRAVAQEQTTAGGIPIAEIPAPPPLDLQVIAPANVPETANFFSAGHDDWPPFPFSPYRDVNLLSNNVPTYFLKPADRKGGMPFLLFDDRAIVAVEIMEAAAQEQEALLRPMNRDKTLAATEPMEPKVLARGLAPLTDDLLVDIEDVTNGIVSLNILNPTSATNNPVWDVWMALQFSGNPDNWTWLARTEPGQTNMLVAMPSETEAYVRLGATNNDVDSDGILDSWMSQNFAHVTAWASDHTLATNDFDGDGYDNATAFANGTSPNILRATTRFPSLFVNQRTVSGTCAVEQGVPFYFAVLVDSTNLASAAWHYYTSSNFSVTLPDADGNHQVRVLLRGLPADATPIFDDTEIMLDRVAPVLMITNPISASATVTKPYLQLLGNANEPLSVLTYDITNATGWRTNLPVSVIDQAFDTNAFDFTTNYFQAFDVALATNANYLTLRVTDRAGNTTTTNLSVTLDYAGATNPPTMQMTWPTNGMVLSGDTFYVRGQLGDETASMVAQIVDGGGITNEYSGIVERNGTFWVAGLALGAGTNTVQFIATDAAGNVTQDMLNLIKSDLALNITSTPDGESLYDGFGTVSGTVGESGCSVSVNGVAATVSGTDWTAENVPILGLGTAIFDIVATPASGPAAHLSLEKDKPAIIKVTKHFLKQAITAPTYTDTWLKEVRLWADDTGGMRRFRYRGTASRIGTAIYPDDDYNYITDYAWSDTNAAGIAITTFGSGGSVTGAISSPFVMTAPDQQLDHTEGNWPYADYAFYVHHYYAKGVRHEWPGTLGSTVETLAARTEETLFVGGKSGVGRETLFCLSANAYAYDKPQSGPWYHTPATTVTNGLSNMSRPLDDEGKLWCLVADNSKTIITTKAEGKKHVRVDAGKQRYELAIMANGVVLNPDTVTNGADFCVGQEINFEVVGLPNGHSINDDVAKWTLPGTFVNTNSNPNCDLYYERNNALLTRRYVPDGTTSTRCWYVLGVSQASVSVDAYYRFGTATRLFKQTLTGKFNVHRPVVVKATPYQPHGTPTVLVTNGCLSLGWNGTNDMSFSHQIQTDNYTSGNAGYVQLVSGEYTVSSSGLPVSVVTNNGIALDGQYGQFPRGQPLIPANTNTVVVFWDGPRDGLFNGSSASMDLEFSTYLMFKPDGGIWVPLRLVNWSLKAEAANGAVVSQTGNGASTPSDNPCATFPHWDDTFLGY